MLVLAKKIQIHGTKIDNRAQNEIYRSDDHGVHVIVVIERAKEKPLVVLKLKNSAYGQTLPKLPQEQDHIPILNLFRKPYQPLEAARHKKKRKSERRLGKRKLVPFRLYQKKNVSKELSNASPGISFGQLLSCEAMNDTKSISCLQKEKHPHKTTPIIQKVEYFRSEGRRVFISVDNKVHGRILRPLLDTGAVPDIVFLDLVKNCPQKLPITLGEIIFTNRLTFSTLGEEYGHPGHL